MRNSMLFVHSQKNLYFIWFNRLLLLILHRFRNRKDALKRVNSFYTGEKQKIMEYYISVNNDKRGPYSIEELKARGLTAETLVMAENSDKWTPAWQVEELRPAIRTEQPIDNSQQAGTTANGDYEEVVASPVDNSADGSKDAYSANPGGNDFGDNSFQQGRPVPPTDYPNSKNKKGNGCVKELLITVVAVLAIVGIAVLTCPNEDAHKSALTNVIAETVDEEINGKDSDFVEDDMVDKLFQQISGSWTKKVIATAVDNLIHVDNHVVFSAGKVRLDGKNHTVSIGVFGHIFTVDKEDLKAATERYYSKAERNVKDDLQKKASKMIQENVIDPAAEAAKKMIDDAIHDFIGDFGGSQDDGSQDESEPSDTTSGRSI